MSLPSINGILTGTSQNINKMNIVTLKSNVGHKNPDQDSPGLTSNGPMRTSSYGPIMDVLRHLWKTVQCISAFHGPLCQPVTDKGRSLQILHVF